MTYCTACGQPTHSTDAHCAQCGALQRPPRGAEPDSAQGPGPLWLPVAALACGLFSALALLAPTPWSTPQTMASGVWMVAAIGLGCTALARQERGHHLALAGAALGALGVIGAIVLHLL